MRKKYKLTGCARFLIFLLIFTPIVLIGVSIYNGNNPIEQVKELLNIESSADNNDGTTKIITEDAIIKEKVDVLEQRIRDLEKEIKDLKSSVKVKDQEIQYLKQQLGNE